MRRSFDSEVSGEWWVVSSGWRVVSSSCSLQFNSRKILRRKDKVLDGADVHAHDVVDLHQLFDQERFAELDAYHFAVMAG